MVNFIESGSRAGYTSHGQKKSSDSQSTFYKRPDEKIERFGIIVDAKQSLDQNTNRTAVLVSIRFDDKMSDIQQGSFDNYFFLEHTLKEIATIYGDIEDLIGERVQVFSSGNAPDQGKARIISGGHQGNLEKASKINPFSTILAPAGGGL